MQSLPGIPEDVQKQALEHALTTNPVHDPSGPWLLIFAGIVILFSGFLNVLALKFIFRYVLKRTPEPVVQQDDAKEEIEELRNDLTKVKRQLARKIKATV